MNLNGNVAVKLKVGNTESDELSFSIEDIIELNIVEDIYDFCMSGNITFYDRTGWTELLEHVGGVYPLVIMWKNEDEEFVKKMFSIYYTEPIVEESQLETAITKQKWYFLEPTFSSLTNKRYSKSWSEKEKASNIFESIFKDFIGYESTSKFIYNETPNESFDNFYMPNWTPAEAIKWLKERCSGSSSNMSGYLFFNNSLGSNFVTLPYLFEQEKAKNKREKKDSYVFSSSGDDLNRIFGWWVDPPKKLDEQYLGGGISYGYDFDGKSIKEQRFLYTDFFENNNTGNALKTYGSARVSTFSNIGNWNPPVFLECEPDTNKIKNIYNSKFICKYFTANTANITVRGSATRYAGMVIDINWKSAVAEFKNNKMMEGLWMIKSITHQFIPTGVKPAFRQLLVCMKPGYNNMEIGKNYVLTKESTSDSDTKVLKA